MNRELIRLIKNIIVIAAIAIFGFIIYQYFFKSDDNEIKIDETPIHIESIKTIAEISTISYKDEVVIDSVEFYKEHSQSLYDPREWLRMYDRNVKRRLTLIIRGEVKYGVDLTSGKYSVESNADTIWMHLPEPKILDVLIVPSKTEIFQEKGKWKDRARKKMEMRAKMKLKENAEKLKLQEKARKNTRRLFKTLVQSNKTILIQFDYER